VLQQLPWLQIHQLPPAPETIDQARAAIFQTQQVLHQLLMELLEQAMFCAGQSAIRLALQIQMM